MSVFKAATKVAKKLRGAFTGVSGSGKTYSCLAIATALGGRIAVIDTERGSASLYASRFRFDAVELNDHSPLKYVAMLQAAAAERYDVVIVDSLSHAWNGTNGALAQVDAKHDKFGAWKNVTPQQLQMVNALLAYPGHVLVTMRVKSEYILEETTNKSGNKSMSPRRVGMQAIQRDGLEYEFDLVGDMDEGVLTVSKSRLLDHVPVGAKYIHPGQDIADAWHAFQSDAVAATSGPDLVPQLRASELMARMGKIDSVGALQELWADVVAAKAEMQADHYATLLARKNELKEKLQGAA